MFAQRHCSFLWAEWTCVDFITCQLVTSAKQFYFCLKFPLCVRFLCVDTVNARQRVLYARDDVNYIEHKEPCALLKRCFNYKSQKISRKENRENWHALSTNLENRADKFRGPTRRICRRVSFQQGAALEVGRSRARSICARNRRGFLAVSQCLLFLYIPLELNQTQGIQAPVNANGIIT